MDIIHACEELLESVSVDGNVPTSDRSNTPNKESDKLVNDISSMFGSNTSIHATGNASQISQPQTLAAQYRNIIDTIQRRIESQLGYSEDQTHITVKKRIYNECASMIGSRITSDMAATAHDMLIWAPCASECDALCAELNYLISQYKIDKSEIEKYEDEKNKNLLKWNEGYKSKYPAFWLNGE